MQSKLKLNAMQLEAHAEQVKHTNNNIDITNI